MKKTYNIDCYPENFRREGTYYWAGRNPPSYIHSSSMRLFVREEAFRERPDRHGNFDAVYFVEENLGKFRQWRIILDEMVRLLRPGCKTILILRLTPVEMHRAEFASFLERRRDCSFLLLECPADDLIVLECIRNAISPGLDSLGFGVISDGKHPDRLCRFVESLSYVRGMDRLDWQLALCGPSLLREQISPVMTDDNRRRMLFVDEPDAWHQEGWITCKKNLLVGALSAENLIIVHDRYVVPQDFLDRLTEFGADFSLVVPRQFRNGMRFPDWTATEAEWDTGKTYLLPYGEDSRFTYVNGGALIAKREILAGAGAWSNLLFWNQSEDVELTRRLVDQGITPRIAPNLCLEAIDAREGYERAFERTRHDASPMPPDRAFPQGIALDLCGTAPEQLENSGLIAWPSQWQASPEGLIAKQQQAEFVLCHVAGSPAQLRLTCSVTGSTLASLEIRINGRAVQPELVPGGLLLPLNNVSKAAGGQLVLTCSTESGRLVIASVELEALGGRAVPLCYPVVIAQSNPIAGNLLGTGWWGLEPWGLWSDGMSSNLHLPMPIDARKSGTSDFVLVLGVKVLPDPDLASRPVGIACNGLPVACLSMRCDGKTRSYRVRIPHAVAMRAWPMTVNFSPLKALSPAHGRNSDDRRLIGFGLTKVDFYKAGGTLRRILSRFKN